ncbi:josephin protein [Cryptosporidium felis]|nr:josephin protein [Cryptosporidium felis]
MNTKDEIIVYWEKQGNDRMCALHSLNSLLQGPYFDEFQLSRVAREIDDMERRLLQKESSSIRNFGNSSSQNVSDDGFFSIMVLQECLQRLGYSCIPAANPKVQDYILYPSSCFGYIINSSEHWVSIRCIKGKWFNLDSLKHAPSIMDYFEVSNNLQNFLFSGKSVFVVQRIQNEAVTDSIPLPDPDPFLRPIKNNEKQRYYLKMSEIERLIIEQKNEEEKQFNMAQMVDEGSVKNFLYTKKPAQHSWPATGGNALSVPETKEPTTDIAPDDLELQNAIRESAIDYAKNILLPDEPSSDNINSIQLRVRTKLGFSFVRRFDKSSPCTQLFSWIEYEMALKGNPIQSSNYSLVSQYPFIRVSKLEGDFIKISSSESDEKILDSPSFTAIGINENLLLLLNL